MLRRSDLQLSNELYIVTRSTGISLKRNMNKTIIHILILLWVFLTMTIPIYATESIADSSASLKKGVSAQENIERHIQKSAIRNVLSRYSSPMVHEAENFIVVASAMNLDPYLLPSIAGVESGFGRVLIQGSNNPFGWNVGRTMFPSWSESIAMVGYALRNKYIDDGADTLEAIGYRYAGGSTTWAPKVNGYIQAFEREEEKIRRYNML